ncbi:MAG: type II toxin-antitoxin system VapC family toxin [Gammaproteobacteria bacterium]|nr:type II toxin-antitoxin system VapC family toxin [Gammaproteobacteria bacterium]MCP5425637.1 type II toxin-antitoxin system VapC family toxin [Gammaproteobacteria bacterium]MCP5458965.1 type II toxin-antitoxin system VapC family toxin [Gammaproteobacteria bacterium]
MIAVDATVLVRLLIDDAGQLEQIKLARTLASRIGEVYVPLLVLVECVSVLENAYCLERTAIVTALTHLQTNSAFVLQDESIVLKALDLYRAGNAEFADAIVLAQAQREGLELHTFDKRLARLSGVLAVKV